MSLYYVQDSCLQNTLPNDGAGLITGSNAVLIMVAKDWNVYTDCLSKDMLIGFSKKMFTSKTFME